MTIDDLLVRCRNAFDVEDFVEARRELIIVTKAVISLLGVGMPCGHDEPYAMNGDVVLNGRLSPDDARGLAAALLRTADEAEAQSAPGGAT